MMTVLVTQVRVILVMMTVSMTQVRVTPGDDDGVDDIGASYRW